MSYPKDLFKARVIPKLPENYDEVLERVVILDTLPGGFGQTSQPLPKPIEVFHFKIVKIADTDMPLPKAEYVPAKMISAEEGLEMIRTGAFQKAMVPKKLQCTGCGLDLAPGRVLHCQNCRPHLGKDPGEYVYCGVSGE